MKTKNLFSWNILLLCLGYFLFITSSSRGMFTVEYLIKRQERATAEEARQQAEEQQRARTVTAPDNQSDGSSTAGRWDLSNGGPSERPPEEVQEIVDRLEQYEYLLKIDGCSPVTEQERELFISQVAAEIDARKTAAAKLPTASTATVTHLVSSAPVQAAESTQKVAVKAAAISLSAPVKKAAAAVLPPPPPQESAFDKQKKETLRDLKEQIATARRERATHQATKDRLDPELQRQLQQQAQQQKQSSASEGSLPGAPPRPGRLS